MAIERFEGDYRFLSNFYPAWVEVGGIRYPTNEHAYQAQKSRSPEVRRAFADIASPREAKRAGRSVALRPDWEQAKKSVMLLLLLGKFSQNPDLAKLLAATGDQRLVEGNSWHDNFWGSCQCPPCALGFEDLHWTDRGLNYLGRLLMAVRDVVQAD